MNPRIVWLALAATCFAGQSPPSTQQPASAFDPLEKTIPEIRAAIDSGVITCTELVQWYINRIEPYDRSGPHLNAVRVINPRVLQIAAEYDRVHTAGGAKGALFCIPLLIQDNINALDMPTTAGSVALKNAVRTDEAF